MGFELFNTLILLLLVVAALIALRVKDLLTASVVVSRYLNRTASLKEMEEKAKGAKA